MEKRAWWKESVVYQIYRYSSVIKKVWKNREEYGKLKEKTGGDVQMMEEPVEEANKSVTDSERIAQLEEELKREKASHAEDARILKAQVEELMKRYTEALEEIARLKSMLNNNSGNTSLPPSTDRKGREKSANRYHGRVKSEKKAGGQTGHKGKTLTKAEAAEKLASGQYKHEVIEIGERRDGPCVTKCELDLEITPVIREIRIYADMDGTVKLPERNHSDVTYGATITRPWRCVCTEAA